jgi:hypothetical protein
MKNDDNTFNRRRAAADFPGAEVILRKLKEKPTKRRVGFLSQGAPARGHTDILHPETRGEEPVGQVTLSFPLLKRRYEYSNLPLKILSKHNTQIILTQFLRTLGQDEKDKARGSQSGRPVLWGNAIGFTSMNTFFFSEWVDVK